MSDASKTKLSSWGQKRTNYADVVMTDESVAHFASLGLTLREIAALFCIEENTLIKHHHDAFKAGKAQMKAKPRIILFEKIRTLNEKFDDHLAHVGEFALDDEGNEVRVAVDTKLGKLLLDYLAQANRLLPQEVKVEVTKNEFEDLSDEELQERLRKAMENK